MTDTPAIPAPIANGSTPSLNKALAAVQAEIPPVAKGQTAKVDGTTKDGRPVSYSYDYADLADCSQAILPLLGRNGLAFSCRPDLIDGKFALIYELLHESGESKGGIFPLPSGGKPQELGGLLTYYRRYALCSVTGLAPAGDDDDAQSANTAHRFDTRSAGAAFDSATPAPPPARQAAPAPRPATVEVTPLESDDPWYDAIEGIDGRDEAKRLYGEVAELRRDGQIDEARAMHLGALITAKVTNLELAAKAGEQPAPAPRIRQEDQGARRPEPPAAARPAAESPPSASAIADHPAEPPEAGSAGKWVAAWRAKLAEADEDGLRVLQREVGAAVGRRTIPAAAGGELTEEVRARRAELNGVPA